MIHRLPKPDPIKQGEYYFTNIMPTVRGEKKYRQGGRNPRLINDIEDRRWLDKMLKSGYGADIK